MKMVECLGNKKAPSGVMPFFFARVPFPNQKWMTVNIILWRAWRAALTFF